MKREKKEEICAYLFMAPGIVVILFVYLVPFLASIVISLTDWNGISRTMNFIGLRNYIDILNEKSIFEVLYNNLRYFVFIVLLQNILAIFLAVLLNTSLKGRNFFRAAIFLPNIICTVAVGYMWTLLFDPFSGPISAVMDALNIPILKDIIWLGDPTYSIYVIILTTVWQWVGYNMVIYLAGLQSVPNDILECARIDGATSAKVFWYVTLPMLAPSITINIIVTTIGTLKIFDLPYIMTGGGPGHATESLAILIYQNAFTLNRMGYSTAVSLILFVFILIISIVEFSYLRRREEGIAS